MATDIVQGLFGMTPEAYQLQQQAAARQQAAQFAQMDPFQQANYGLYLGGNQLGGAIGGMLGAQDPMLQRISQQQALLKEINPSDAASLTAGIKKASEMGNPQLAMTLSDALRNLQKTQAESYKAYKEALTPEQRNAQALAAMEAAPGTPEFTAALKKQLERLTTKTPNESLLKAQAIVDARAAVRNTKEGTPERAAAEDMLRALQMDKYDITELGVPGNPELVQKFFVDKFDPTAKPIPAGAPYSRATARVSATANMPPQEKEEQGARGKMLVAQYSDISKQAGVAARTLPALESSLNILDKGFDTGFGTQTIATGARILGALGVKDAESYATNAQSFLGAASQAVLTRQLEQKGPQTESDAARITQTGAQLGNTKEANRFLVSVAQAQFKRDLAQRDFYDKWWKQNKTYDGAEDAWFSGEGGKSLFDSPLLSKYKAPVSSVGQIPSSTRAPGAGRTGNPLVDKYLQQ